MLKVFYGNDVVGVRTTATTFLESLHDTGVAVTRYESEQFAPGMVASVIGTTSLFGGSEVVVFDTPSEQEEYWQEVVACIPELVASGGQYVVIENALLAANLKLFTKAGAEIMECKKTSERAFDTFQLCDALSRRDKKLLWTLYQTAKRVGSPAEELIGVLWWQLKVLRIAAVTNSAIEADMKEYPYKKAKQALRNFKPGEVAGLSASLLQVYHDGHGGVRDIDLALEGWVLGV